MKYYTLRVRHVLLTLACGLFLSINAHAQMKIGNHPTQIHPASILELESNNQALRLTQGDTAEINRVIGSGNAANSHDLDQENVKAAEGMIMYNMTDTMVYVRSHGYWHKLIDFSVTSNPESGDFWQLSGNAGTDSSVNLMGTQDAEGLRIGTNGQPALIIDRAGNIQFVDSIHVAGNTDFGANVSIADSLLVGSALHVKDSVTLEMVREALPTDNDVLVISPEGVIRKRDLASFGATTINNITGSNFHFKLDTVALSQGKHGPWIDSLSGSDQANIFINIPHAGARVTGIVTDSTQAFGGSKSFVDSIAIGSMAEPNSTLQVNGNVAMAAINITTDYDLTNGDNARVKTIIANVGEAAGNLSAPAITVTLPTPVEGRIYTIKKIGDVNTNQINAYVEIVPSSGTFEDGGIKYDLYNNWTSVTLQAQNGNWYIVK